MAGNWALYFQFRHAQLFSHLPNDTGRFDGLATTWYPNRATDSSKTKAWLEMKKNQIMFVGFKVIADIVTIATIANLAPFDSSARGWSIPNILFCFQKECDLNKRYIYSFWECGEDYSRGEMAGRKLGESSFGRLATWGFGIHMLMLLQVDVKFRAVGLNLMQRTGAVWACSQVLTRAAVLRFQQRTEPSEEPRST